MASKDETNLILFLGFIGILYAMNNPVDKLDPDDPIPTKQEKENDPEFIKDIKRDINRKTLEAQKQAEAETEVRINEGLLGTSQGGTYFSYGGVKQYIDTRIFGDWSSYQDEYRQAGLSYFKDGL